jgi:hypothetical protein
MVHALGEAHRVLKPDGILVDLRPAMVHPRVGVVYNRVYTQLGSLRATFGFDRAANRAVAYSLTAGLFKTGRRMYFNCKFVIDTIDEFRTWVDDFIGPTDLAARDRLFEEIERAIKISPGKTKIFASESLVTRLLRKLEVDYL